VKRKDAQGNEVTESSSDDDDQPGTALTKKSKKKRVKNATFQG